MTTLIVGAAASLLLGILSWSSGDVPVAGHSDHYGDNHTGSVALQMIEPEEIAAEVPHGKVVDDTPLHAKDKTEKQKGTEGKEADKRKGSIPKNKEEGDTDIDGLYRSPAPFISGIKVITLSPEERGQIGLQADSSGVWYFSGIANHAFQITMNGVSYMPDLTLPSAVELRNKGVVVPPFDPVYITDDFGNRRLTVRRDDDPASKELEAQLAELAEQVKSGEISEEEMRKLKFTIEMAMDIQKLTSGKLVPVLVRTGQTFTEQDKANRRWRPDCIFWYEPTDEFLAALPERIRRPLQRELYVSSLLQDKPQEERIDEFMQRQPLSSREMYDSLLANQSSNDGVSVVAGDSYLDSWRAVSGAITMSSVLPNPAHNKLYINYRLATPRLVTFGLYDVNGQLVQTLSDMQESSGENLRVFDLKDITPGMYLLSIATDAGERAVQRVIVE